MQSKTVLLFALVCMATICVTKAADNQCMCVCCKTPADCKQDFQWFHLDDCTDPKCAEHCPAQYVDCRGVDTSKSMCMPDSATENFSRHTIWSTFILASIVTAIFRI